MDVRFLVKKLIKLKKENKCSNMALGKMCGIPPETLNRWVRGYNLPTGDNVEKLDNFLHGKPKEPIEEKPVIKKVVSKKPVEENFLALQAIVKAIVEKGFEVGMDVTDKGVIDFSKNDATLTLFDKSCILRDGKFKVAYKCKECGETGLLEDIFRDGDIEESLCTRCFKKKLLNKYKKLEAIMKDLKIDIGD